MMQWKGIPVSAGIARGPALHLPPSSLLAAPRSIAEAQVNAELARFDAAVRLAEQELSALRATLLHKRRTEEADILRVQLALLHDRELIGSARASIVGLRRSAQAALEQAMGKALAVIRQHNPAHFKERTADIEDVIHRVIRILRGEMDAIEHIEDMAAQGIILICGSLSPSEAVRLDPDVIAGIALIHGSANSHFAIIARSIGIPTVVGLGPDLLSIRDGESVLLDGTKGTIMIHAAKERLDPSAMVAPVAGVVMGEREPDARTTTKAATET
ncbi:phosphoenolpyruvate-utilizing N-terminal domain-containing protein, partial [Paenibacillus sp. 598K]|uniref:phosphoenolpyruvate-utilizing N-terminal domain-containing protein n=1 Tax=Paenibacillus sp. 598K TaxID=1117987 RepID=UPI0021AA503B